MTDGIFLIARYQTWVYYALGLMALFYLRALWQARQRLRVTLFGLEKEAALARQNRALAMLLLLGAVGGAVYLTSHIVVPNIDFLRPPTATPQATTTPVPSPTPVRSGITPGPNVTPPPLVVDSSGCQNPQVTLTAPQANERITGTFEVKGAADIPNFAFYKYEIAGDNTNGAWVPLGVGTLPVSNGTLGTFDAAAYNPGHYAFRLVVMDTAGGSPMPCVVAVTFVSVSRP